MSEEEINPNFDLELCLRNKVKEAKRYLENKHKKNDESCEEPSYVESFIYYFQDVENLLDLYQKKKEKIEAMNKGIDELTREKQDLKTELYMNSVSKDKITSILGLEKETTEQTILQYIETLESENARLEDIEDKKVQIEYGLVFNKGVKSVKDKIKAKIKELEEQEDWYIENKSLDDLYGRIDELKELLKEK